MPTTSVFSDPGQSVSSASSIAEQAISQCQGDDPNCLADALENYADALRSLPLAPGLSRLPDIVSRAAHRIRQARTPAQATKAIKVAIAEVHKTIALIRADDPIMRKAETRQGALVAQTLEAADDKLEKAVGL